jgi:hypothetical protein
MAERLHLVQLFLQRTFVPDPPQLSPIPDEEAALTRAGVMDATARKFAVWRRAVLFVSVLPCAFASFLGLIDVITMGKAQREVMSGLGLFLFYIQALAMFVLPVAAVLPRGSTPSA